ncbi:MAG: GTP-binding protein [Methyloprofundus sp.]|nr:GTP-binding protein [Methyloprofundus sp.]
MQLIQINLERNAMYLQHKPMNTNPAVSAVAAKNFKRDAEVKIVFVGSVGSGKTTAVIAVSDIDVAGTEAKATEKDALHRKPSTTVAMEYGQANLSNTKVHIYGTPGQRRFDFMASILCEGAAGIVILIDNGAEDPMAELDYFLNIHGEFLKKHPAIIGVTHYDDLNTDTGLIEYHQYCKQYGFTVPVMRVDAREKKEVSAAVSKLLVSVNSRKESLM